MPNTKLYVSLFLLSGVLLRAEVTLAKKSASTSPQNMPASDLKAVFNSKVQSAEWMTRPKQGLPGWVPSVYPTTHSGVRVTLDNGQKFLIHKGPDFGKASETVVTSAAHMSNKWQAKETREFGGTKTVSDFVKTGGQTYSLLKGQHCHGAARDMMNQK